MEASLLMLQTKMTCDLELAGRTTSAIHLPKYIYGSYYSVYLQLLSSIAVHAVLNAKMGEQRGLLCIVFL